MKNTPLIIILISCFLFLHPSCSQKPSLAMLESEIRDLLQSEHGNFAVAFKDIESEESLLINEQEIFHAASTMKTPVMIELFKRVEAGDFSLYDSLTVHNVFYSIVDSSQYSQDINVDSEGELYNMIGKKRSLYDLAYDMIIASSNLATNILIDLLDARRVTQSMRELGARNIEVLRGVEDIKAFEQGLSNTTSALDLLIIFEKIAKEEIVTATASQKMIEILFDQKFNDIIPLHLPDEVKVAHKTGSITGVHHDSGIVYLPDGRKYVLVLLSKNLKDFEKGTQLLARISKRIYDYEISVQ